MAVNHSSEFRVGIVQIVYILEIMLEDSNSQLHCCQI